MKSTLFCLILLLLCACGAEPSPKVIVIAGKKSHPATVHEYLKTARLIKTMLENAENLGPVEVEVIHEWPSDESIFDQADVIMTISDGQDGPDIGYPVPFMEDERMEVVERHIERGVGFITFHFSTFAPDAHADQILSWTGGYFDWQNEAGQREWYSDITTLYTEVEVSTPAHPISNGLQPYRIVEEFYFDMRFPEDKTRWTPILSVPALVSDREHGKVVAWAVERANGGRGFGTTTGHFYAAWKHPMYRKLMLNAITWASGSVVPEGGVNAAFFTDEEVTTYLFGTPHKGLLVGGANPGCQAAHEDIRSALDRDDSFHLDVTTDMNHLAQYDLRDYGFVAIQHCTPDEMHRFNRSSAYALTEFVASGGGLLLIDTARRSLYPDPSAFSWGEYEDLFRPGRALDERRRLSGPLRVVVSSSDGWPGEARLDLTDGVEPFEIKAGIPYYEEADGTAPLLEVACDSAALPVARVYSFEKGRVFQTTLGGHADALSLPAVQRVLSNAARWTLEGHARWNDL